MHSTPQHLPRRAKSKTAPFGAGVQWRQRSNEFSPCRRHPPSQKGCRQAPACRSVQGRRRPTGRLVRRPLRLLFQSQDDADDLGAHIGDGPFASLGGNPICVPGASSGGDGAPIGELWFQRVDSAAPEPALLLKLLFTDQALSIQVHPDDAFARTMGLPHGKTEAWYVLSAEPGAEVSLGLNHPVTPPQLRAAIVDGTIVDLTHRQVVQAGEAIVVSAGTIHAIGAGLVIAEIQQRSDATFRLFDHGRDRELHPDAAVGAAVAGPAPAQAASERLSAARLVVATSPVFRPRANRSCPLLGLGGRCRPRGLDTSGGGRG